MNRFFLYFKAPLWGVVLLSALLSASGQQGPLGRDDAVRIVLARNPGLAQARSAIAAAHAHIESIRSAYYPSLNASASYMNVGPDQVFTFPGMGTFALFPMNNYDAHLGAGFTLYDFGKRDNAVASARSAEISGAQNLQNLRKNLAYQVLRLFDNIVLQEKAIAVKDEEIADRRRHLSDVKKKVETGSATSFDTLRAAQQLDAAGSERIDMTAALLDMQTLMRELLGMPQGDSLRLRENAIPPQPRLSGDSLIACALAHRSDYKVALTAKKAAQLALQGADLENMPVFGIQASAGGKNGILPDINNFQFDWTAGAQISMPLYDGKRAKSRADEAQRNVEAADAGIANLVMNIRTEVLQAKADADAAFSKLSLIRTQVRLAQDALSLANIKYEAGVITNLDVLDAEKDFAQAKLSFVAGQYMCLLGIYRIDEATGTVLPEEE